MTIIIKDMPGLSERDLLEGLTAVSNLEDGSDVQTGSGGFVVPPDVAYRFLGLYLSVTDADAETQADQPTEQTQEHPTKQPATPHSRTTARRR
jgi:hypothetical protein